MTISRMLTETCTAHGNVATRKLSLISKPLEFPTCHKANLMTGSAAFAVASVEMDAFDLINHSVGKSS